MAAAAVSPKKTTKKVTPTKEEREFVESCHEGRGGPTRDDILNHISIRFPSSLAKVKSMKAKRDLCTWLHGMYEMKTETPVEEKKADGFYIVALPLQQTSLLDASDRKWLDQKILEWGQPYGMFEPVHVSEVTKAFPEKHCAAMRYLLAQLLLRERTVASDLLKGPFRRIALSSSRDDLSRRISDELAHIGCREIPIEVLVQLVYDIYEKRDAEVLGAMSHRRRHLSITKPHPLSEEEVKEEEKWLQENPFVHTVSLTESTSTPLERLYSRHLPTALYKGDSSDTSRSDVTLAIIVLDSHYRYVGHVYAWPRGQSLLMMGIRSSLWNLACRRTPRIAHKLLIGVASVARLYSLPFVVVHRPLPSMSTILDELAAHFPIVLAKRRLRGWKETSSQLSTAALLQVLPRPLAVLDVGCRPLWVPLVTSLEDEEKKETKSEVGQQVEDISRRVKRSPACVWRTAKQAATEDPLHSTLHQWSPQKWTLTEEESTSDDLTCASLS